MNFEYWKGEMRLYSYDATDFGEGGICTIHHYASKHPTDELVIHVEDDYDITIKETDGLKCIELTKKEKTKANTEGTE